MSTRLQLAEDFSLIEGQKILGCDCVPFCKEAEYYFVQALRREDRRSIVEYKDVPVAILTVGPKPDETGFIIVRVRRLLQKILGNWSGIICDEGFLKGFIALQRRRVYDVFDEPDRYSRDIAPGFVVGRPLNRKFKILRKLGAPGLACPNVSYDPGLWEALGQKHDVYEYSRYDDL